MKQYLLNILALAMSCGVIDLLTPAGEREGLRRGVRLLAGLCLLCVMIRPLQNVRQAWDSFDLGAWAREAERDAQQTYTALMEQKLTAVSREQLQEDVLTLLTQQCGLAREDVSVTVGWEGESMQITQVWVAVHGRAVLCDPRRIESAVTQALACPCTVSVGAEP